MSRNYGTVLSTELLPGWYCCVRTRGVFGWLIRAFTRSPVDHALVCLGGGQIAEATPWGVRADTIERYRGQPMWVDRGDVLTEAQRAGICAKARSFTGREYGWATIALIALRLLGVRSPGLTRMLTDRDALTCSQLVAEAGTAEGQDWLCGQESAEWVEPVQLLRRPGIERVRWAST